MAISSVDENNRGIKKPIRFLWPSIATSFLLLNETRRDYYFQSLTDTDFILRPYNCEIKTKSKTFSGMKIIEKRGSFIIWQKYIGTEIFDQSLRKSTNF